MCPRVDLRPSEPDILAVDETGPFAADYDLVLQSALAGFDGHFDGLPVLPGVVQIEWAIRFAQRRWRLPGGIRELRQLKFVRLVRPETRLRLRLEWDAGAARLRFEYRDAAAICSGGTVVFSAEPAR